MFCKIFMGLTDQNEPVLASERIAGIYTEQLKVAEQFKAI